MLLSEVFTQLAYGELSQLNLAGDVPGTIKDDKREQVLAHVVMGLTALYSRFDLKMGEVKFELQAGRINYPMTTAEDVRFDESEEDFLDDVLKIESVQTEEGFELSLNDKANKYSCFTSSALVLRVPSAIAAKSADLPSDLQTDKLVVGYRAKHPEIKMSAATRPTSTEIELPASHLAALLYYVASRVNNPIGMSNEFHAGNSYAAKYEKACQELEVQNLQIDQGQQNERLVRNGWV